MSKWFFLSLLSFNSHATTIELFVDQPIRIPSDYEHQIIVHDLSAPERLSQQYLPELPPNPESAKKIAMEFFASEKGQEYQDKLKAAYQHKTLLMRYNVQKIPAIVFDEGDAVIYGLTDVEKALTIYQQHNKAKGDSGND